METKITYETFDYNTAEEAAKRELGEFPPIAEIADFDGNQWRTEMPLPFIKSLTHLFVLADRDAACDDARSGQLRNDMKDIVGGAFERGHDAGRHSVIRYIEAIREGRARADISFLVDGDAILDWVVAELG
jgi:hypothetical protein